jgi:(E)-4-hydroxy-3-methyl-but-2-enyl pyrophosphate reductase
MKLTLANTAGFCMGVRRAVDLALEAANKEEGPIYTYGPLIHNPQVLDLLEEKGITVIREIPEKGSGTVIIRAHGVPPDSKKALKQAGYTVIEAACPRVIKVQTIINRHAQKGHAVIIIGDQDHPEVVGLLGYATPNGHVVDTIEGLDSLPPFDKAIIVAQTTQNTTFFESVKIWADQHAPHYKVFDTICDSTEKRQKEISQLAKSVDAVVVVGGHTSGNTQRLAEIARHAGKPTFAVESEEELDKDALLGVESIAITAGASTPNWVTNRVYRALEEMPSSKRGGIRHLVFKLQKVLLLTSIYVSIGAGCLCYACNRLLNIHNHFSHVLMAVLYVLSMHLLNNLIGSQNDRYKDPNRAKFYTRYRIWLGLLALIAGIAGLATAFKMGWKPFLILLTMSITGLLYNLPLLPRSGDKNRYFKIRDIPGSKTILITMAWGIVTAVLPALAVYGQFSISALVVFSWAAGMVFIRTAFFDILDIQGDRIVGKETLPILLGEKKTVRLLKTILCVLFILLLVATILGTISKLGFFLTSCPLFLYMVLIAYEKGRMLSSTRLEFLVETHFVLAGAITFVWSAIFF